MTQRTTPVAGVPMPEPDWELLFDAVQHAGVVGDPGSTVLQVFADGTGMFVSARTGMAFLRGHLYILDAQLQLAIANNGTSNPRLDRVVLRLDPSAAAGSRVVLAVVAGTPAAVPTAPALAQTATAIYELPLATIRVEANNSVSITLAKVTDERRYAGTFSVACTSTTRPYAPRVGQWIYEMDTGVAAFWNGTVWVKPYDQVKPYARRYVSGVLQAVGNAWVAVEWPTSDVNGGIPMSSASALQASQAGVYKVSYRLATTLTGMEAQIRKNAGGIITGGRALLLSGGYGGALDAVPTQSGYVAAGSIDVQLGVGDTVEVFCHGGGSGNVYGGSQPDPSVSFIQMEFIRP